MKCLKKLKFYFYRK